MVLRPELLPPALDPEELERLTRLAAAVVDLKDTRQDYHPLMAEFNRVCGGNYEIRDFVHAAGSMDAADFAAQALTPRPPKREDITDEEYVEIIRRLLTGEATERETHYWLQLLHVNLPTRHISDLIYFPKQEMTPEETLAEARKFKPIIPPPPRQGWDEQFQGMAETGEDRLLDADTPTRWQAEEWEWESGESR